MSNPEPSPQLNPVDAFLPPTRQWFESSLGQPTPPQVQGWPAIQRGEHTLILAPTGSGKTLTAFLWAIDQLFRFHSTQPAIRTTNYELQSSTKARSRPTRNSQFALHASIEVIYISPLKALNNDIERNLRVPLAGIRRTAEQMGVDLPEIDVAVRSGDTPSKERQAMLRKPPHILITTPESLYLLLTSPTARSLFIGVRTVIIDEIHTLAGSKRGVHLSLSLERLQHLNPQPFQRIGLSATIQPLDEVARYLGGMEVDRETGRQGEEENQENAPRTMHYVPRPVTIVNANYRKQLDLRVETVVENFRNLPGDSLWPSLIPRVTELIRQHKTTLIFVNDRRQAERTADRINEQMAVEAGEGTDGDVPPIEGAPTHHAPRATEDKPRNPQSAIHNSQSPFPRNALIEAGVAKGLGMMAAGTGTHANLIPAHHGSVSKERRLIIEQDLKSGKLPALVGTSSLELGIDIGSVDLVVQIQSPKAVAQGLQRVGRAGHLVGQTSRGRIFPTHREDVMEAAAVAGGMLRGEVEPIHTPRNALDVLAQQIVAMVSVENWAVDELYVVVRRAYAYQELTLRTFHAVLDMLAGRFPSKSHKELRARLVWDRVNNQLAALPGSRLLALTNGGTISDRGAFAAYLADGKTKLGELDEEFVYETRVGDTLMLGSQVWRVLEVTDDKVIVADAAGATPRMPFWRGDFPWRPYELGRRVGMFRREVSERLQKVRADLGLATCRAILDYKLEPATQPLLDWLRTDYALDDNSAWQVVDYVAGQLDHVGTISSDHTVLVELFEDALGDPRMVIQTPFGGKVNGLWSIALTSALREQTGVDVEVQSNDDGILFRFPNADAEFPLNLVTQMGVDEARERILQELPNSALFGAQFRQNAARALLLPGAGAGKRTPFWLQRLRAKDLLQLVRQFQDFPIVAETYRDCLEEVMDLPHLEVVLRGIQSGAIQVEVIESLTPSPVAQSLLYDLIAVYMYEWDTPKAERQLQTLSLNRDLLQDLLKDINLSELLRSEAVEAVRSRLQRTAPTAHARTAEELAAIFQEMGDLTASEIALRTTVDPSGWVNQLAGSSRIVELMIPTSHGPQSRWVDSELAPDYGAAFAIGGGQAQVSNPQLSAPSALPSPAEAQRRILERFLAQAGPVTLAAVLARYAFPADWLQAELDRLVRERQVAHGQFTPSVSGSSPPIDEFVDLHTLEQMQRRTLSLLRGEIRPVPFTVYADFLARWQHLHPQTRLAGSGGLRQVLQQLRAAPIVGRCWERDVLPLRLARYQPAELAALCQSGELVWVGSGGVDPRRGRIRFFFRGEGGAFLESVPTDLSALSEDARSVYEFLKSEGAVFQVDLRTGLGLTQSAAESALLELVMAGLATNDTLLALQRLLQQGGPRSTAPRQPYSSLETELAARLGERRLIAQAPRMGGIHRPSRSALDAAKRRVRQRLEDASEPVAPTAQEGRWTLVHRFGVLGKPLPLAEQAAQQTRQLLARYGVVTHDSLSNEIGAWDWGTIFQELSRMELRGEVRRGYFVQGLPGVQFASTEAVERLRQSASSTAREDDSLVVMNACDPANLYGPLSEDSPNTATGEPLKFAHIPSSWLVLSRGLPVLLAENSGTELTTIEGVEEGVVQRALQAWREHLAGFESKVTVNKWNGEAVLGSVGQSILQVTGFYRDYLGMTWERAG